MDRIDKQLQSIHQRAQASCPDGYVVLISAACSCFFMLPRRYQPATAYYGAAIPTVDVSPAFDNFADHLQLACDEVYVRI